MASIDKQTVESGNMITIGVASRKIGRCQSLTGERDFGTQGVYELDSIMPQEHVFLKYTGTVTLERYRMAIGKNFSGLKLAAFGADILQMDILDIFVTNRQTNKLTMAYHGCSADTYTENYRANEITGESLRMYYLYANTSSQDANVSEANPL